MGDDALWQNEEARCGVVLREVFLWLPGADLACAGATCRVWRRAAAEPALWRRLVLRAASPRAHDTLLATTENYEWREEYVCAHAPWKLARSVQATAGGETLVHGALAPRDSWLALAADDASVTVWAVGAKGVWSERWRYELREARGWASAARVLWSETSRRLLVAGPRALADVASSWELLVLQFDDDCHGREISRTRCSAGAAGCWAGPGGESFLSLQTSVLAPGVACTAVWLNAATQETQSEFAGVTTRLLRVYNEDGANILVARVLELPWSVLDAPAAGDDAAFYRATRTRTDDDDTPPYTDQGEWSQLRVLVLGWDGGRVGRGGRVSAWSLGAPQPPPLEATAAGSLRARYLAHRERMRAPPPEPPPPAEADVRALCTLPEAECGLPAPPLGLAVHPGGRCLWVNTADGQVLCLSVPALVPLRSLVTPLPRPAGPAPAIYYAEPSASHHHVAAPAGALSGSACVWATLDGTRAELNPRPSAPAAAVLLLNGWPLSAIVLAGDAFHHARVYGRSTSTSCSDAGPPPAPPPCKPHPRPPCRARPERSVRAVRVVCCPPTAGQRPPCPQREPTPSLTCADVSQEKTSMQSSPPRLKGTTMPLNCGSDGHGECGVGQDRVARRLALAKAARREDYEREAAQPPERVHAVPTAHYRLGCERECARATDGRDYSIPCECPESPQRCGPARTPPPARCVELAPDDACRIDSGAHLDPCAHRPRVLLQIDRSATSASTTKTDPCPPARTLKSRIMQSLKTRPNKGSTPLTSKSKDSPQCGRRNLHISAPSLSMGDPCSATESKAQANNANGLESMLQERAKLQEAGRGRAVCGTATKKRKCPELGVGGQLELPVPSGARRVRVHVAIEDNCGVPLMAGAKGTPPREQCPTKRSEDIIKMAGTKDSWLSIKSIQKKISGYRDETVSKRKGCDPKTGPAPSSPGDSPQTKPPPPAKLVSPKPCPPKPCPPKPCPANPCAPKKPKTEEKDKPKPLCRFLPLGLTAFPIP